MNIEAAYRVQEQKARREELGIAAWRQRNLDGLDLKTIIKEGHGGPVHALAFNQTSEECYNLFAAVSSNQVNVYDDSHMGDFMAVILQYNHEATAENSGGDLQACAWVNMEGISPHPHGDACLVGHIFLHGDHMRPCLRIFNRADMTLQALADSDGEILLLSIVETSITSVLKGHVSGIIDLAAAAHRPGMLASLGRDGNVRVWDIARETCTASHSTDATCLAVEPQGTVLLTGGRRGAIRQYSLPSPGADSSAAAVQQKGQIVKIDGAAHSDTLECIRILPDQRVISRSCDGMMHVWHLESRSHISTFKVPSCSPGGSLASRCQLGHTPDGAYACAGNQQAHTYVFDTATGRRVCHFSPAKASGKAPVRACGISHDCTHLLSACGTAVVLRYEVMASERNGGEAAGGEGRDKMDQT